MNHYYLREKSLSNEKIEAAASVEAAARSAKLVTAKKKEKNHYNQQPTRYRERSGSINI